MQQPGRLTLKNSFISVLIVGGIVTVFANGCAPAEQSAAMVLDNAGGVVKANSDKLWIEPEATPLPRY